jgi:hypothetical protein
MKKPEVPEGVKVTSRRAKVCDEVRELKRAGSNMCCAIGARVLGEALGWLVRGD